VNRERSRSVVAAPLLQNVPATRKNFFREKMKKIPFKQQQNKNHVKI
jgi:hypothetical protein